jgi:putative ATP-binding cassette transporter
LFLPQKPYLPLGSLRRALYYPGTAAGSEEILRAALVKVGLEKFVPRLDEVDDWSRILSLGEQQRLAFARVLLQKPDWVFLDEATSALDEPREAEMYEMLQAELPKMGVVSVGHRSTLFAQHQQELKLAGDGNWELRPI